MANPDQPGNKVKHTFAFGEERRTLWLNAHGKDDYGRHRGYVLYGMDVTVAGDTLTIRPGAVYTPWGTRLFFEWREDNNTLQFDLGLLSSPKVVAVTLRVSASPTVTSTAFDPRNAPRIDDIQQFDANTEFLLKEVAYHRNLTGPALNLDPRDPILLTEPAIGPAQLTPNLSDYAQADVAVTGSASAQSLQWFEVPLAYFVIGVNPATGNPPSSVSDRGVTLIQSRNVFSMISEFMGTDVFRGRVGPEVQAAPVRSAVSQQYGVRETGVIDVPELRSPKFGTPSPGNPGDEPDIGDSDRTSWRNAAWTEYRQPNFLRDGENFLWALRRLDYFLRLWLNRTGDQALIAAIQDGGNSLGRRQLQLDGMLSRFDGNITDSSTNEDSLSYPDNSPAPGPGPLNDVLKSGLVGHVAGTVAGNSNTQQGDSHFVAVSALNLAMRKIFRDLLGVELPRRALREAMDLLSGGQVNPGLQDVAAVAAALRWNDGPAGTLPDTSNPVSPKPDNVPVYTGSAGGPYAVAHPIRSALQIALERASVSSVNWLRNSAFEVGDPDDDLSQTAVPPYWDLNFTGGTAWTRTMLFPQLRQRQLNVTLGVAGTLIQDLDFDGADVVALFDDNAVWHVAFCVRVPAGTLLPAVVGYEADLATEVFRVQLEPIPANSGYRDYSALFRMVAPPTGLRFIRLLFSHAEPASFSFDIVGASLGPGPAPMSCLNFRAFDEFVHRDGGDSAAMRGDLNMGDHDVRNVQDAQVNRDVSVGRNLDVTQDATLNNLQVAGSAAFQQGLSAENQAVMNVADPVNPLDATNKAWVEALVAQAIEDDRPENVGGAYRGSTNVNIGYNVKITLKGGGIAYQPAWGDTSGPCHSNCHSNCKCCNSKTCL